ncbi:MAG: porin family protein [Gammaproteobacteria bacterium]|nr:porin family protein [Gammaproteobacteria bacterium]
MRYLPLLILTVLVSVNSAQAEEKLYAELDAMRAEVELGGAKFKPYVPKIKAGYYIMNKVALELQYVMSGDADDSGSNLKIDKMYGAFLRLESNLHNRARIYLLGGYTQAELSVTGNLESLKGVKDGSYSWGMGVEDQIVRMRNTFLTLDYMQYYNKGGYKIKGISLGFRYLF